jgi:hypothetical protein
MTHATAQSVGSGSALSTPAFTGTNGDVCDGVLLWCARGAGVSAAGSILMELQKGGVTVASVTVLPTDIPLFKAPVFFKFAATHTFDGSATYTIKITTGGSASSVFICTNGTANNFAKLLRLTSAASAPAASDVLVIVGEQTGAGTSNTRTVTMDSTSTSLNLGTNVQTVAAVPHTTQNGIDIGQGGTLQYGVAAATAYYLKMQGHVQVWAGGTLNLGTAGTPIPADSSAVLEFNNDANVKFGLEVLDGATVNMRGNAIANVKAKLAANAAAAAVSLTTDISTGWKSGDLIGVASTTRTSTECESRTLTGDASGTTLPIAALTNAHGGIAPIQAELVNLTRNVKVRGISTTNQAYLFVSGAAVWSSRYVEFSQLGSATTNKRGFDVQTVTSSFDAQFCSLHDFIVVSSTGFIFSGSTINNITIAHNVFYNVYTRNIYVVSGTSGTNITIDDNVAILSVGGSGLIETADVGITLTNNVVVGSGGLGILLNEAAIVTGNISGNVAHSNSSAGMMFQNMTGGSLFNSTAWRNNSVGVLLQGCKNLTVDGVVSFGNSSISYNYGFNSISSFNVTSKNVVCDAGTTLTCPLGLSFDLACFDMYFENCSFGASQAHATGDVSVGAANLFLTATFSNCLFNSPTEVANLSNLLTGSYLRSAKHDQVQDSHKTWAPEGTVQIDTTLGDPATPSSRLTPSSASSKLKSAKKQVPCASGQQVTVSIEVRKSVVGDGTAYNGAQPRLIVEKNVAAGLAVDTVLATASGAAGAWETLTATLPAPTDDCVYTIFVDCDGTQGWVNLDHVRLTNFPANYSGTMKYWRDGLPFNGIDPGGRSGVDFLYWLDGLPSSLLFPFPTAAPAGDTSGEAEGATALAPWKLIAVAGGASDEALGVPTFIPGRLTAAPQSDPSGEAGGQSVFAPGRLSASHSADASSEAPGSPALIAGRSTVIPAGLASDEAFGTPTSDRGLRRIGGLLAKLRSANRRRAVIR